MEYKLFTGHCLDHLKTIPDASVQLIITSPPYYAMRRYGGDVDIWDNNLNCQHEWIDVGVGPRYSRKSNDKLNNKQKSNAGSLTTVGNYIPSQECEKCKSWKGELGWEPTPDQYCIHLVQVFNECRRILKPNGCLFINIDDKHNSSNTTYPLKTLLCIPQRLSILMVDNKWILRNTIIWQKPSAMTESVRDRFSDAFEYILFFSKSNTYLFNKEHAIEPYSHSMLQQINQEYIGVSRSNFKDHGIQDPSDVKRRIIESSKNKKGRNMRSIWVFNKAIFKPYDLGIMDPIYEHFAVMPDKLCDRIINICSNEGDTVLDPFSGIGSTGISALKLNRKYIGIEKYPHFNEVAERRFNLRLNKLIFNLSDLKTRQQNAKNKEKEIKKIIKNRRLTIRTQTLL